MTQRLGVLGGTFDPIHYGHLMIAEVLGEELSLDGVLFVPAGAPPHKPNQPITPVAHRLRMTELGAIGNPRFSLSTLDLQPSGQSYTADLLARVAAVHPDAELFFLMGLDSLRDLPTWHHANSIGHIAQLAVAQRPGVEMDIDAIFEQLPCLRGRVHLRNTPGIDLSATLLRDRVGAGKSIRYMTPESVRRYILDHGLYSTPPENRPTSQSASSR